MMQRSPSPSAVATPATKTGGYSAFRSTHALSLVSSAFELSSSSRNSGLSGSSPPNLAATSSTTMPIVLICGLLHGFDRSRWTTGAPQKRLNLLPAAQEHILAQDNGKERYLNAVKELSQAFALAVRQIISRAVASEGVMDIFAAAGLDRPDISVLSEEFLAEVRGMPQRNLAAELLQKLLNNEISVRRRKNVVQARSFAEMLEQTLRRYQNRAIEAAQVIEELIQLAKEMREAGVRGESLGLSEDELAFYDALETNDSAVQVLGDDTLRDIARELVDTVRSNVTIDWTLRENVRAHLRVLVRRILRKYGYPPDKQQKATMTVLEQAEVLSEGWATF